MKQLLLATHNTHKLEELRRILAKYAADLHDVEVVGLGDVGPFDPPVETGASFVENAVLKARVAASQCHLTTIADDSGITIDALNGMPGVLSARWAGKHGDDEANLRLVLAQLADVPDDRLGAAFVCAAALVVPGTNRGKVAEERMLGHIVREPVGENGFGYDPIFVALGESVTNAELTPERKDEISHRGKALRALVPYIITAMTDPSVSEPPPAPAVAPAPARAPLPAQPAPAPPPQSVQPAQTAPPAQPAPAGPASRPPQPPTPLPPVFQRPPVGPLPAHRPPIGLPPGPPRLAGPPAPPVPAFQPRPAVPKH